MSMNDMNDTNKKPGSPSESQEIPSAEEPRTAEPKTEGKMFSQSDVDSIVKREKAKAERRIAKKIRKEVKAIQQEPTSTATATTDDAGDLVALRAEIAAERRSRQFSEALVNVPDAKDLTPRQRKVLKSEFDPENPDALIETYNELFGITKTAKEEAPVVTDTDSPAPTGPPYQPGAPSAAPREASLDPTQWDAGDIARLRQTGEFLPKLNQWADQLPGSTGLFKNRKKVPIG
jgi:hypothetical protein